MYLRRFNGKWKCNDFCQQIGENGIAKESISKFYRVVRNRIKERMHNNWKKNFLRIEINTKLGYCSVEIEESKTISSSNEIYWMYGIVDHNTKEARVFCVLKNWTKQKLLPIIKDNIYSNHEGDHMDLVEENDSIEIEKLSY